MRSIGRLFAAFGTLADSLLALASTVDIAMGRLRQQLAVEAVEVLEHQPAGEASPADPSAPEPATAKRGRKSA
jgi:hypothetical protein